MAYPLKTRCAFDRACDDVRELTEHHHISHDHDDMRPCPLGCRQKPHHQCDEPAGEYGADESRREGAIDRVTADVEECVGNL